MSTFQFQCPQGHLLEGDLSQAGQTCNCPTCGMLFLIPTPPPAAAVATPFATVAAEGVAGTPFGPASSATPELLHIPCPKGHELETPPEMLNQDVLCPHCGVQFRLREKDSVEYKRRKELEEERRINRAGKLWFNWAIAIAVLVAICLIGLAIATSG